MKDINDNKPVVPETGPNKEVKEEINKEVQQRSDPQITELNNFRKNDEEKEPKGDTSNR